MKVLGEKGNLTAEPGSKDWMIAVKNKVQSLADQTAFNEDMIGVYIRKIIETKAFEKMVDANGKPFDTLQDLIDAPYPYGFNNSLKVVTIISRAMGRVV